jgi:tetratricopeptide (TPR) repeat protein
MEQLQRLADDFPGVPKHRFNLALGHYTRTARLKAVGRLAEAEQAYSTAISLAKRLAADEPGQRDYRDLLSRCHINLGNLLKQDGRPQEAAESYSRGLAVLEKLTADAPTIPQYRDNQVIGYSNLGDVLFSLGRRQDAEKFYCRSLALLENLAAGAPNNPRYQNLLADLLADCDHPALRDPARAVAAAQRAVQMAPGDGDHWLTLGVARYRAGDWKGAAAALHQALERRPGEGSDLFYLALAHGKLGEQDRARQWYTKAVEWTEKHQPRDPNLSRLRAEAEALLQQPNAPKAPADPRPGR